ncbi:MAPEG family protein [Brevundimonas sp.]|uniref:MAPEG family protein n=1 Tax=Brevundimonas sp. TaxID=1871086 RepID=UPI00286A7BB5|nr:MAPEG family protein [Brevundimonas sp.]
MNMLTEMTSAQATALWSGLMILWLVYLGIQVALARRSNKVLLGDGSNPTVLLASRVFGNAAEYTPIAIGALAVLSLLGMPAYVLHVLGGLLFLGRLIHGFGLSNKKVTAGRVFGMVLTWTPLAAAAAMLIVHAFVGTPHG